MAVPSMIRIRWAAVGAAVAVTLGAGGVGLINATSPDGAAAFVAITPCRLFDTRPAPHTVGGRTAPLGPDETYDIAARGAQGNCTLPDSGVGVVLNVTAADATQATFLTLFPAGETRLGPPRRTSTRRPSPVARRPSPVARRPSPVAPPAPNAVTVDLSTAGEFSVFNRFGNAHVLADVVGYYTDHHHDDRYYTKTEADATGVKVAALDTRVPFSDSVTLAGGGFSARSTTLEWATGSACFYPNEPSNGMRHNVRVTTGSTVTAIAVRARNATIYAQEFDVTLWAQRPGTTGSATVHAETFTIAQGDLLFESRIELPSPELVDAGEALYLSFTAANTNTALCSVEVEFNRPG